MEDSISDLDNAATSPPPCISLTSTRPACFLTHRGVNTSSIAHSQNRFTATSITTTCLRDHTADNELSPWATTGVALNPEAINTSTSSQQSDRPSNQSFKPKNEFAQARGRQRPWAHSWHKPGDRHHRCMNLIKCKLRLNNWTLSLFGYFVNEIDTLQARS
uniref:Uncharacterized protein n=1 Tax=Physcomitrium patens TaxID=3218 RepID=A9TRN3_PHYPA|nr:hypothetical protein PHYPA_022830 [Physcomitrium patens]